MINRNGTGKDVLSVKDHLWDELETVSKSAF